MDRAYHCAYQKCKMKLWPLKAVDYGDTTPVLDDVLICGVCGCPSKVTLSGTVEMTAEELAGLSDDEKKSISFAIRAVKQHVRNN